MKRRNFLQTGLAASLPLTGLAPAPPPAARPKDKILNAYYFRAHMYTLVPRHVREDLKWMADQGTTDHLIYYYPRNVENPDQNMAVIARHIRTFG